MKKIILFTALIVAAVAITLNIFGAAILGTVLQGAIGAPVTVGRINLGLLTSNVGLYDVKIKNPEGFKEKGLTEIHEMSVKYDLPAIFHGQIHLKEVRLDFGDLTVEKNGGKVNLLEIGAVKGAKKEKPAETKTEAPKETKTEAPKAQKGPELKIDEVFVNIGKVRYVDSGTEVPTVKEYDLGIHDEKFKNVTDSRSLIKSIVFLILRKIGLSSITGNLDLLLKGVGGGVAETFQKILTA